MDYVESETWQKWSTSVLNLLNTVFGSNSVHSQNFKKIYDEFKAYPSNFEAARGVFRAAKADSRDVIIFDTDDTITNDLTLNRIEYAAANDLYQGHD
jgi:hypothetical protein